MAAGPRQLCVLVIALAAVLLAACTTEPSAPAASLLPLPVATTPNDMAERWERGRARQRAPADEVLLGADEIELVDMSPHALRQRMKHGNVYPPERSQVALERFFTEGNLTALRELALRLVAQRVEGQLEDTTAGQQLSLVTDRVLVLVDGSLASVRAIRRAAKLAGALHAAFVAVVVETPATDSQPFDRNRDLQEAIDDAVDLGADLVRVEAPDVATGLELIARSRRATHLVVPHHEVKGFRRLTERSLVDQVLERLPDLEVHAVNARPRE
jgi:two-component system sensor histidine kinase KdpD